MESSVQHQEVNFAVSNIPDFVDIENVKALLQESGINALDVHY